MSPSAIVPVFLLCIAFSESIVTFYLNSCLVIFHMKGLRNGVKLNPPILIQMVMAVTNLSMRGLMLGSATALWFPIYNVGRFYHATIIIALPFHLNFNYWLVAWLCTYYCTTITDIRHQIFVWVRRNLQSLLPLLLSLSALVSLILTLPSIWYFHIQVQEHNSSLYYKGPDLIPFISDLRLMLISHLCTYLPFLVTLGSLVVTMSSLFRHIRKVKRNDSGFAPPSLQAHISAVRTMILLLLLSVISNIAEIIKLMSMSMSSQSLQVVLWLLVALFPLSEASIIIQSSRKLKKMFSQTFCAGRSMAEGEKN